MEPFNPFIPIIPIATNTVDTVVNTTTVYGQRILSPIQAIHPTPIPEENFTSTEFAVATVAVASAATIGANLVDVQKGTMTPKMAVGNAVVKGVAASLILTVTPKRTAMDIALTAVALAGAGYAIDRIMKKSAAEICGLPAAPAPNNV